MLQRQGFCTFLDVKLPDHLIKWDFSVIIYMQWRPNLVSCKLHLCFELPVRIWIKVGLVELMLNDTHVDK